MSQPKWVSTVCLAFFAVYAAAQIGRVDKAGLPPISLPKPLETAVQFLRFDNRWSMFPSPRTTLDGWIVMPGTFKDDSQRDLFSGRALTWDEPRVNSDVVPGFRWMRHAMYILWGKEDERTPPLREAMARYWCRENAGLVSVELVSMKVTHYDDPASPRKVDKQSKGTYSCAGFAGAS